MPEVQMSSPQQPDAASVEQPRRLVTSSSMAGVSRLAVAAGFLVSIVLVYWPSSVALNGQWTDIVDHTYTHGYLLLATSMWLAWRDRKVLAAMALRPMRLAFVALVLLSAAWVYFWKAAIQDAHLLLLPLILYAGLLAVLGRRAARVLLFPVAFLYFAMPVWSDLNSVLQRMSVDVIGLWVWLTGIPAYVTGNIVHLPAGSLEIATGCSGMHFFIVGLALAALYGEVMRDTVRHRLWWYGILGALSLFANWLRIFVIVAAAYVTHMRTFLVLHHYWFGWGVFAVSFAFFLWLAGRLVPPQPGTHPSEHSAPSAAAASARPSFARFGAALACLAILPLTVYAKDWVHGAPAAGVTIRWPANVRGWSGPQLVGPSRWTPVYQNPTALSKRAYLSTTGYLVDVFVVTYRTQYQGAKLEAYGNSLIGKGGLEVVAERTVHVKGESWRERTLRAPDGQESLLWSDYRIGRHRFVWGRASQLWYGIAALTGEPVSSLVALRAACSPNCRAAAVRLAAATVKLQPSLRMSASSSPASRAVRALPRD